MWSPAQNLDPIGSAVLTVIGYNYKQTNKQIDRTTDSKQSKYIKKTTVDWLLAWLGKKILNPVCG